MATLAPQVARHTAGPNGFRLAGPMLVVGLLKAGVGVVFFVLLYQVLGLEMVPAMRDQLVYLADIDMIQRDLYAVFASDEIYHSNNTLYSRAAGVTAWMIGAHDAPLIPAVLLNTIFHVATAYLAVRVFVLLGGRHYRLLFLCIALSPTIWAYSLFALRDLMICFFFLLFLYSILDRQYWAAPLSLAALFFLRPLFIAYALCAGVAFFVLRRAVAYKNWPLLVFVGMLVVAAAAYFILGFLGFFWVFNLFRRDDFSVVNFVISMLGYGVFTADLQANMAGGAGLQARILMFDSLLVPIIYVFSVFLVLRKDYPAAVKIFTMNTIILLIALNFSYLAIQDNFPFRKLLPMFPLMYIVILLALEKWLNRRTQRSDLASAR